MASKDELRKAIDAARKANNSADAAVKRLTDLHVPKQARKARLNLLARLRRIGKRMEERIPVLKERLKAKRHNGAADAVKWGLAQIGKTETPAGSNDGPFVRTLWTFLGYSSPVPWCGCFVGYAAIKVGGADIPTRIRLGFTPYICQDAAAGANGLTKVSTSSIRPGDFVVFDFNGGGADHVGLAVGPVTNGLTDCVEGNTSSSAGGSQDNGGCVARRQRPVSQVLCVARPNY